MKIGFIFPSSDYLYDPFRGDPHTHFQLLTVLESRLGDKVDLELIDLRGINRKFIHYRIPECNIYLHSVYTRDFNEEIEIVNAIKNRYQGTTHIAGGPHVIEFQNECLKQFDTLVFGDGEEVIFDILNDWKNNKLKKIYEQSGPIDVNDYPFPKRHFLPKATIARKNMMNVKKKPEYDEMLGTTVIFSRGCISNCYFCALPNLRKYNPRIRYRRPEFIKEEIEYLKKEYDIEVISLLDEIGIPPQEKVVIPYLKAIKETGIWWRGQCRANGFTLQTAKLARKSGCLAMGLGVESASQRALDFINKRIDIKEAKKTIKMLNDNDIETRVYLIMGLPGEELNIKEKTWKFITETKPDLVILSIFTVRPGTMIYNRPDKFGIKRIEKDWDRTMHMYGRYEKEIPRLTFEYKKETPWGKSLSNQEILNNYLELQEKISDEGFGLAKKVI